MSGCSDGGRGAPRDGDALADSVVFEGGAARALPYWLSAPSVSRKLSGHLISAEKIVSRSGSQPAGHFVMRRDIRSRPLEDFAGKLSIGRIYHR